jgi:cyanophycin synthetase
MKILSVRALRGPNIWARFPVLEALVDLGPLRDSPSTTLPGLNDRLMSWLPGMIEHRCSPGYRGGFFHRLRTGTYLAHILEHVTLEVSSLAGTPVGFGRAREIVDDGGVYKVAIEYEEESVGRACLETGFRLLLAAVYDHPFDLPKELQALKRLVNETCFGPSTRAIVKAAVARRIPVRRLNNESLVMLGYGCRHRRIWTAETDETSAIAESIAQDKDLTKSLLRSAGIPVPEGRLVLNADDAWAAAQELDTAVVLKPVDANHGRGVFVDLTDEQPIRQAYALACKEGSGVLVEQFAPGWEHRLLVVGGELVAACRGEPSSVVGDGRQTIAQLIDEQINSDPRRGTQYECPLNPVLLDDQLRLQLGRQGRRPDDVLTEGERVIVRRNDALAEDVTDLVHPSIVEHALYAAKVVGLDIAGIDVVVEDVTRPLEEQGGMFVEVNAGPGLAPHLNPKIGQPRPVGEAIINLLFPPENNGRIPIVAVTGTNGKTTTTRMVSCVLKQAGHHLGMACTDGVFVDGRPIDIGDCAGPRSARNVLLNPVVTAAVFECARGGILREGLGFDFCDVAIVTNIAEADHLGGYFIDTPEQMFKVKRCPVDVVLPTGTAVLNALDPLVAQMGRLSRGSVTYFSLEPDHSIVEAHRQQNGRVVVLRDGWISCEDGEQQIRVIPAADLPCTHGGRVMFQVENVLAAVGAAWHLNIPWQTVRDALIGFQGNLTDNPARFSVLETAGKTLVVFDGRNVSALRQLATGINRFPATARSVVYSSEADRTDAAILAQATVLGQEFDRVYLCEVELTGVRPPGAVASLLKQGVQAGAEWKATGPDVWSRASEEIASDSQAGTSSTVVTSASSALTGGEPSELCIPSERRLRACEVVVCGEWSRAVETAWGHLKKGELLAVQAAGITETVRKVQSLLGLEQLETRSGSLSGGGATVATVRPSAERDTRLV